MGGYPLFLGWVTTSPFLLSPPHSHRCSPRPLVAYCLLYWSILSVRRYLGIITPEMMAYSNKYLFMGPIRSCRVAIFRSRSQVSATRLAMCLEFSQRGASVASSSLSCRKCVIAYLPSIPSTDLLQLIIPITMVVTVIMLKARYNVWQARESTPRRAHSLTTSVRRFWVQWSSSVARSPPWCRRSSRARVRMSYGSASLYSLSYLAPSPSSLRSLSSRSTYGELACASISVRLIAASIQPSMDIFVVNSMDSAFQLVFTFASLPIVLIPGFGSVPFSQYVRSHIPSCLRTDSRRTSQTPDFASQASLVTPTTTVEVR